MGKSILKKKNNEKKKKKTNRKQQHEKNELSNNRILYLVGGDGSRDCGVGAIVTGISLAPSVQVPILKHP